MKVVLCIPWETVIKYFLAIGFCFFKPSKLKCSVKFDISDIFTCTWDTWVFHEDEYVTEAFIKLHMQTCT